MNDNAMMAESRVVSLSTPLSGSFCLILHIWLFPGLTQEWQLVRGGSDSQENIVWSRDHLLLRSWLGRRYRHWHCTAWCRAPHPRSLTTHSSLLDSGPESGHTGCRAVKPQWPGRVWCQPWSHSGTGQAGAGGASAQSIWVHSQVVSYLVTPWWSTPGPWWTWTWTGLLCDK